MKKQLIIAAAALTAAALGASNGAQAQDDEVEVILLHAIPGLEADVLVDGEVVIPSFETGEMQDLSAFAGQTLENLEIRVSGSDDLAFGPVDEFPVPESGVWTVVAHLSEDGMPVVTPYENDVTPTADGEGRITLRHVAAAGPVDLVVGDDRPIEDAENGTSVHLSLPAGPVEGAQLALTGEDPIADVPAFELEEGQNAIVYGVFSAEDDEFDFYIQNRDVGVEEPADDDDGDDSDESGDDADDSGDGTPAPTRVNTGSPFDSSSDMLLVSALGALLLAGGATTLAVRRSNVS